MPKGSPQDDKIRRVDTFAAHVAEGMIARVETVKAFTNGSLGTGLTPEQAFAQYVFKFALALQAESENH